MVGSAALTAATVTVVGPVAGAVYRPEAVIVPAVELPPAIPFTVQFTAVFDVPVTDAVNCCDWPVCIEADVGVIDTETAGRTVTTA